MGRRDWVRYGLVEGRTRVPGLATHATERARLRQLVSALIESNRLVCVYASAGAGKTTAVAQVLEELSRPAAWLTVTDAERDPGRLLLYLEAALSRVEEVAETIVAQALASRLPPAEVAGILAERHRAGPKVLVLDDVERLAAAPAALEVIDGFISQMPPGLTTVVISRRDLPLRSAAKMTFAQSTISDQDLAFRVPEAADALARIGREWIDAEDAVAATAGWVTGVLFEAWRSAGHVPGTGGEADPLNGYLSSQILEPLSEADREFLITTSILDVVTEQRARVIGAADPAVRLASLRGLHLPITWSASGAMRCHRRFREFLEEQLVQRGDEQLRALRSKYGRMLAAEGQHEEAVEELISNEDLDAALDCIGPALDSALDRLALEVVERWIAALSPAIGQSHDALIIADLRIAVAVDDYRRGIGIVRRMEQARTRDRLASMSSRAAVAMAVCYAHVGDIGALRSVLAVAGHDVGTDALRALLEMCEGRPSTVVLPEGGEADVFVTRVHYGRGHLRALPPMAHAHSWAARGAAPYQLSGLRAMGQVSEALEQYREALRSSGSLLGVWGEGILLPELLADAGHAEEAWQQLVRGREALRSSGSVMFELLSYAIEAKLALRLDRDAAAASVALKRLKAHPAAESFAWICELAAVWESYAAMLQGRDVEAHALLMKTTESMRTGRRILELPSAAVYLSEAAWRLGDEDGADAAAALALEAAHEQGSDHVLLQALADFPEVISRSIDLQRSDDSAWHRLGRALRLRGVPVASGDRHIELREFGEPALLVDDEAVPVKLSKSLELLAYLLHYGRTEVSRSKALLALFDGRDDDAARSYLRMAIRKLHGMLPDGALSVHPETLRVDAALIVAESKAFEVSASEARMLHGEQRLNLTLRALERFDRGAYLAGLSSGWVVERREVLERLAVDVRADAAELALGQGRYDLAERLVRAVLESNPYRDGAWRLLMRIHAAVGDHDRVVDTYRDCVRSLAELGVEPSTSTRQQLRNLRH
jgi:DNA-binding SARP family transcriptional activator